MNRLLFDAQGFELLDDHLTRARPAEDGAFILFRVGRGTEGTRLLVTEILLPNDDSWDARGAHNLRPSGQWLSAAIGAALEENCGLAFIHSHPNEHHPPNLSPIDERTSKEWSISITPTLQAPFASLVWTPNGVAGWMFEPTDPARPRPIERVEAHGMGTIRRLHRSADPASDDALDDRQRRALSSLGNARLRESRIAIVGAGGTGSPLADQLVRMGVERVALIDADQLDHPSNLRRVVGARPQDFEQSTAKVNAVARHLRELTSDTTIDPIQNDVRTDQAKSALIDSDVVIVTTDTHSSRAFVNQLAVQYSVPLIDVGVVVGLDRAGGVSGMPIELRVVLDDEPCLWCRGVLDAARIRAENLPTDERLEQAREGYVQGLEPQPSLTPLNTMAASIAIITLLRLIAEDPLPSAWSIIDPWEQHWTELTDRSSPRCLCADWRRRADTIPLPLAG